RGKQPRRCRLWRSRATVSVGEGPRACRWYRAVGSVRERRPEATLPPYLGVPSSRSLIYPRGGQFRHRKALMVPSLCATETRGQEVASVHAVHVGFSCSKCW